MTITRKIVTGLSIGAAAWATIVAAYIVWAIGRDNEALAIRTVKRALAGA